jgi:hypothetical protein
MLRQSYNIFLRNEAVFAGPSWYRLVHSAFFLFIIDFQAWGGDVVVISVHSIFLLECYVIVELPKWPCIKIVTLIIFPVIPTYPHYTQIQFKIGWVPFEYWGHLNRFKSFALSGIKPYLILLIFHLRLSS